MTVIAETDSGMEKILQLLETRSGLVFRGVRRREAEASVGRAMREIGIASVSAFAELLERGELSPDLLIEQVTVGETYFFRDRDQFEFIRAQILPELVRAREAQHTLRMWSAGCASGEEPYSLAILLEEEGLIHRGRIVGTDISNAALAKARRARYNAWSLRGCDSGFRERYFDRSESEFVLNERIRRHVSFEVLNLALGLYPSILNGTLATDLILLRNVLIYFDQEAIREVARRMFDSLAEGGWLVTGVSDPPLSEYAPFSAVVTDAGVFYRRGPQPEPQRRLHVLAARNPHPEPREVPAVRPAVANEAIEQTIEAAMMEARQAFDRGEYERVIELTRPLTQDAAAAVLHVRAIANTTTPEEAEQTATAMAKRHPFAPDLHFLRAALLISQGRDEEAAEMLRQALYLDRSLVIAHFLLGVILRRHGSLREAGRAYRNAHRLCLARAADEPVPLGEGEVHARLIATIESHLRQLGEPTLEVGR